MLSTYIQQVPSSARILAAAVALTSVVNAQEFAAGHRFASSVNSHEIIEYDAEGSRLRAFGAGSGLSGPYGLAFGPNGLLYVASYSNDQIVAFDASGTAVKTISGVGLDGPYAIAFGSNGNLLVASYISNHLTELTPSGTVVKDVVLPFTTSPSGVLVSPEGNIYVSGDASNNIVELDPELVHLRTFPNAITSCRGLLWTGDGSLLVGGYATARKIFKVSLTGTILDEWPTGSSTIRSLAMGPDGRVYLAAYDMNTMFAVDTKGDDVEPLVGGGVSESFGGLAFAPQRFDAKITGKRALPGQDPKSITESCVVSMSPFASWAMVQLNDDVANVLDLTTLFGADALVLQGRNVGGSKAEKQQFAGSQASRKTLDAGMASCVLAIQLAATETGHYSLKKITGTIARDSGDGAFVGKITSGKKRN